MIFFSRARRIITFPFRSIAGAFICFTLLGAITVWEIWSAHRARQQRLDPPTSAAPTAPKPGQPAAPAGPPGQWAATVGSHFKKLIMPETPQTGSATEAPVIPAAIRNSMLTVPEPISLGTYKPTPPPPDKPSPPLYYLPPKRRIPCMLVNTVETGSAEIPIIGIVLENQYNVDAHGIRHLVIPAGVEVHGMAQQAPMRDRIIADGAWTLVWRTLDAHNAISLEVPALALNRDFNGQTGAYGSEDGSVGIQGVRTQTNDPQLLESLALRFASATTRAIEQQNSILNPLTSQMVATPATTAANALKAGAADTIDGVRQQIDKIREAIEKDGYYVAVEPSHQFYLYTKSAIDLSQAVDPNKPPTPPSTPDPVKALQINPLVSLLNAQKQ